jgi:transcriptional regulator with XRE-family HTH domain
MTRKSIARKTSAKQQTKGKLVHALKRFRADRGWTQGQLARKVGVSVTAICLWENGKLPTFKHRPRIASVLGIKTSDLNRLIDPNYPGAQVCGFESPVDVGAEQHGRAA